MPAVPSTEMRTPCGGSNPCPEIDELNRRPFVVASVVALVLACASIAALPATNSERESRIRAVRAQADAFVSGAQLTKNFGQARDLRIDASPTQRTFLRFKANLSAGDVERVNLLLFSRNRSRLGYQVRLVEEPWRETEITFVNAPSLASDFVLSGPLKARSWKAVDVTSLVEDSEGGKFVSFALTTRSSNAIELASRETGLRGPRLVVERRGNRGPPTGETTTTDDGLE